MKISTITIQKPGPRTITLAEAGEWVIELTVPGIELTVVGVVQTRGHDKKKLSLTLKHQAPHTQANTTLKGIARDQSHLEIYGKIVIGKNCPDTQSFLKERILLLSDQASAIALPELEIDSDAVSCSHAASIAPLPEEEIFYLMSRGLTRVKAEELLVEGFLASGH